MRFKGRKNEMRKVLALTSGVIAFAAIALAAGDIPTRYAGSFPSAGSITSITGTFTGSSLTLKYTFIRGTRFTPTTASYSCATAAPNKSKCAGQFRTDDGQFVGRAFVAITWKGGQPVNMHFGKMH
jgi:hypothetical protein